MDAARALGIPAPRILVRHFVPNVIAPILVMGSYYIGVHPIIIEGRLVPRPRYQPPTPSLGTMIADGRNTLGYTIWPAGLRESDRRDRI